MTDALGEPGEVVTANILSALLEPGRAGGKPRPAILVDRNDDGTWSAMGITTLDQHDNGIARRPVSDWAKLGLNDEKSHYWGLPLARVSAIDLQLHIGWVTANVVAELVEIVPLDAQRAAPLHEAARTYH